MTSAEKSPPALSERDRATHECQLPVTGFGEAGQRKLKQATVLITRCSAAGSVVAYELAAAGVRCLVLADAGNVKPSDFNRKIVLKHSWMGHPRVDCAARRLQAFNPHLEILAVGQNANEENVKRLVSEADVVVDCAPTFEERYVLNREAMRQGKPMVTCAVHQLEAQLTTLVPGQSPCLRCIYPEPPPTRKKPPPTFGAVGAAIGGLAAMEVIKLIAGLGSPLVGRMVTLDLRTMTFGGYPLRRDPECVDCGDL